MYENINCLLRRPMCFAASTTASLFEAGLILEEFEEEKSPREAFCWV
jgi:hypothetical protein